MFTITPENHARALKAAGYILALVLALSAEGIHLAWLSGIGQVIAWAMLVASVAVLLVVIFLPGDCWERLSIELSRRAGR